MGKHENTNHLLGMEKKTLFITDPIDTKTVKRDCNGKLCANQFDLLLKMKNSLKNKTFQA